MSFIVKDCALIALAAGRHATNLGELKSILSTIPADSIYHHFWGGLLHPRFDDPEYRNDFAVWVQRELHDHALAERLAIIDPAEFDDLEVLRATLIDLIEERIDEKELLNWLPAAAPFHFLRSRIAVFDSGLRAETPEDLYRLLPRLSSGCIFYHCIDARRRNAEHLDDFSVWLRDFGEPCAELCGRLAEIDPYFGGLTRLKSQIEEVFASFYGGAA